MPVDKRVHQCINAKKFKFVNNTCPYYLNGIYQYAPPCKTESRRAKLNVLFQKTYMGQKGLSYIGPYLRKNPPGSMKKTTVSNTFKHNLKRQYLGKLAGSNLGLLLVFTYNPHQVIYLFIYLFIYSFICFSLSLI